MRIARRMQLLILCLLALLLPVTAVNAETTAAKNNGDRGLFVDVRDYLPEGYVTDGSVDYKEQIQRCFEENSYVYFPGSNDHQKPMVYGSTAGLKTKPYSVVRFGTNAILKRLPSLGDDMLELGQGTHLLGAVIDGNKYAHWPLVKDRPIKTYAFVIGNGIVLRGQNLVEDCFVYNLAGIAFGAWNSSDNKIYRCRAENIGFEEAMGRDYWSNEYASGDGFYFGAGSQNNIVKDCEAYDCSRWGFVITEPGTSNNTFVDCRGGNVNFYCYGFIDVEQPGPGNSLIRCRSSNSNIVLMGMNQEMFGCTATYIDAQSADFPRIIACTTTGGPILAGGTPGSRSAGIAAENARPSPMVALNRVFMSRPFSGGGLRVICSDGQAIVSDNVVYAYESGKRRGKGMFLDNVGVDSGNKVKYGLWDKEISQFEKPSYLRAYIDLEFMAKRKKEVSRQELTEYLSELGMEGKPAYQQLILGEYPFKLDEEDAGTKQQWYRVSKRPENLAIRRVGWHWRTGHTFGPAGPGWHFVNFNLPAEHQGKQTILYFGSVDENCWVYVNGQFVGEHHVWDKPFHFDVTEFLKPGENDIAVKVSTSTLLVGIYKAIAVVVK